MMMMMLVVMMMVMMIRVLIDNNTSTVYTYKNYAFVLYRLHGEDSIQMVTALVLQLIQCSVRIPDKRELTGESSAHGTEEEGSEKVLSSLFYLNNQVRN